MNPVLHCTTLSRKGVRVVQARCFQQIDDVLSVSVSCLTDETEQNFQQSKVEMLRIESVAVARICFGQWEGERCILKTLGIYYVATSPLSPGRNVIVSRQLEAKPRANICVRQSYCHCHFCMAFGKNVNQVPCFVHEVLCNVCTGVEPFQRKHSGATGSPCAPVTMISYITLSKLCT